MKDNLACYNSCKYSGYPNIMTASKKHRPIGILIIIVITIWLAMWNGLRLGDAIYFWRTLNMYGANSLYISISGAFWLIFGMASAWGLWQGKVWGPVAVIWGTVSYTAWYWVDRLFLQEAHANWPFVLAINIILLLIIFSILFSRRTRLFFEREVYERQP